MTKPDVNELLRDLDEMLGEFTSAPTVPVTPHTVPKITAKTLDLIPSIPLTLGLVREHYPRPMTDAEAQERLDTALHEAAHYVAALAFRGSCTTSIHLYAPTGRGSKKPAGRTQSVCVGAEEDAFHSIAGYVWERMRNANTTRADGDFEAAERQARSGTLSVWDLIHVAARFIRHDAKLPIQYAAVGLICLVTQAGVLDGKRLNHLSDWLRPQVPRPPEIPVPERPMVRRAGSQRPNYSPTLLSE